jgi:hypothetical protein
MTTKIERLVSRLLLEGRETTISPEVFQELLRDAASIENGQASRQGQED